MPRPAAKPIPRKVIKRTMIKSSRGTVAYIADLNEDIGEHIVKCVNEHGTLVAELEATAARRLELLKLVEEPRDYDPDNRSDWICPYDNCAGDVWGKCITPHSATCPWVLIQKEIEEEFKEKK